MNTKLVKVALVTGLLASTLNVQAEQFGVALKSSTLGLGLDASYNINEQFSLGSEFTYFSYGFTQEKNDVNYDATLTLSTFGVSGRYHPMSNGFFLAGGLNYNGTGVTLDAKPTKNGTFKFNNKQYSARDLASVNATVDFPKVAPKLSLGWQSMESKSVSFFTELGVMITGSPEVSYEFNCSSTLPASECAKVNNDIKSEEKKLKDDLDVVAVLPVLSVGVQYNF